jgi:hypothetical protein
MTRQSDAIDDADEDIPAGAAAAPAASAPAAQAAPAAGGGNLTQAQIEQMLASIGPNGDGSKLTATRELVTRTIQNPAYPPTLPGGRPNPNHVPGSPPTTQVQIEVIKWVNPQTNASLTAVKYPDNTYTSQGNSTGTQTGAKSPYNEDDTRGPQNGEKREEYHNGQWVVVANPLYKPEDASKPASSSVVEVDGKRFAVTVITDPKNPNAAPTFVFTDLQTNQRVDALPTPKDAAGKTTSQLVKGGDGKQYILEIKDGQVVEPPKDSGIPVEAKPDDRFNVAGIGIVSVDKDGKTKVLIEAPKDPNVKLEHDPKTDKWYEVRINPDGTSSVTEKPVEGGKPVTVSPMGSKPTPGKVADWLWSESERLGEQAVKEGWTQQRYQAELDSRRKFAETYVAESTAERTFEQNERSRESADWRQGMTSGTSIFSAVAPGAMAQNAKMLPGNGAVAAQGFMALLALGKQFAESMGGYRPTTTIRPDGTITVGSSGGSAAALPSMSPADAASQNQNADIAANNERKAADPALTSSPMPGEWFTPGGPSDGSLMPRIGLDGGGGGPVGSVLSQPVSLPAWASAQANAPMTAAAPPAMNEPDTSYLDSVTDDPSWGSALATARDRDRIGMAA